MMANYKYLTNPWAPGLTLTAAGNKVGDVVKFQNSTPSTDYQVWDFTSDGHFINKASGYVIEASPTTAGTVLKLAEKKDNANQKWTYTAYYTLISQQDNKLCIWAHDGLIGGGTSATVETAVPDTLSQRWWLLSA